MGWEIVFRMLMNILGLTLVYEGAVASDVLLLVIGSIVITLNTKAF